MTTKTKTHFIVQTASAAMPQACWGTYKRVAVLEVDEGLDHVSQISTRAKGCHQVVAAWERCNVGTTGRCAYEKALVAAQRLADELNGSREEAELQADYEAALAGATIDLCRQGRL